MGKTGFAAEPDRLVIFMIAETHIAALATSLLCCGALAQPGQEPGIPARAESPVRIDADFPGGNIVVGVVSGTFDATPRC